MSREHAVRQPDAFLHTRAAKMLADALNLEKQKGRSLRMIAKILNYKQATVLSHMARGRVPIPLERAAEIAEAVGLPPAEFFQAAVEQRVPESRALLEQAPSPSRSNLAHEVSLIAGVGLDQLNQEQQAVIKEVAADPRPRRRWLTITELSAILLLRELKPDLPETGLSSEEAEALRAALGRMQT